MFEVREVALFGVNMLDVYTGTAVDASDATVEDGSDPEEGRGETIYSTRDSLRAQSLRSAHGGYQVQEIQPQENCEYWNHIPPSPPHTYTHTHTPLPHAYYQPQSLYCLATIGMLSFVSD